MGLLCLRPSAEVGLSRVVNMLSVLVIMNEKYPNFVPRLYQPDIFDGQREHSDTDKKTIFIPLFCDEAGSLRVRIFRNLSCQVYRLEGKRTDETSEDSLDAFF